MDVRRAIGVSLSLAALLGFAVSAQAQARTKNAAGFDPDEQAMHDYVLTVDGCQRYGQAMQKVQGMQQDPAVAAEMRKVQDANVYNVEKAAMIEKSPKLAAAFKTLGISPRDFVLIPLTVMSAGVAAQYPDRAAKTMPYVTSQQVQFVKDHKDDLERWGLK